MNKYAQMLKEGYPNNPMKGILAMESETWEEGRRETLDEVRTIISECPDCSDAAVRLVINKLRSLK